MTSGLELNDETDLLSLQLLIDYICGHLGGPLEQKNLTNIVRVVIAGKSM